MFDQLFSLTQEPYTRDAVAERQKNRFLYTDTERYKGDKKLDDIVNDVSAFGMASN